MANPREEGPTRLRQLSELGQIPGVFTEEEYVALREGSSITKDGKQEAPVAVPPEKRGNQEAAV